MSGEIPALSGETALRLSGWYLEMMAESGRLRRIVIRKLPFTVGRAQGLHLTLPADSVSKHHAEIYLSGGQLRMRDLGSKNGTFRNRTRVDDVEIHEGDVIHFSDFEFRIGRSEQPEHAVDESGTTVVPRSRDLPHGFPGRTRELRELLQEGRITMVFQPIVLLPHGNVAAYEALGRGRHPDLPESPSELLRIAESIGKEAELSRLFRRKAVELALHRRDLPTIFLNTHPREFVRPGLLESLEELRAAAPHLDLALEIHEKVFTDPAQITELKELLDDRQITLAYDDFGAGWSRLLELADSPPRYLKFDQRWVQNLQEAPSPRRKVLRELLVYARDLNIKSVAEGIESRAEARACAEIGFTHAQGFDVGRPVTIDRI